MPLNFINKIVKDKYKDIESKPAKKFKDKLEKEWENSIKITEEQYGKPEKEWEEKRFFGTTMKIFKNKIKSHLDVKISENKIMRFDDFVNLKKS